MQLVSHALAKYGISQLGSIVMYDKVEINDKGYPESYSSSLALQNNGLTPHRNEEIITPS